MEKVRSGGIHLKISRDRIGRKAGGHETVFSCLVYDHPKTFNMSNEDEDEISKAFGGKQHWFFFELDHEPRKGTGRPVPILEDVKIVVAVENPYLGMKMIDVSDCSTMINPSKHARKDTVVVDGGRVAIRIGQHDDEWYVIGVRVVIPNEQKDPGHGKKSRNVTLPVLKQPRRNSSPREPPDDPPDEPPPPQFEPGVVGWDIFAVEGLRVTLRDEFRNDLDTGNSPGTVIWICEPEGDLNRGDTCRVMWDKTGLRRMYKTGHLGRFELRAVDEDGTDAQRGFPTMCQVASRAKAKSVQERLQREARKHGYRTHHTVGGLADAVPLIRAGQRTPTPRPPDADAPATLKACFAAPLADARPSLATPYLQVPRRALMLARGGTSRARKARAPRVAIVGGGVAALACAQHLAPLGYRVTVFEAQLAYGGRLGAGASLGGRAYCSGCSFFTAASRAFREQLAVWVERGLAVPCPLTVAVLHGGGRVSRFDSAVAEPVPGFAELVRGNRAVRLMDRTAVAAAPPGGADEGEGEEEEGPRVRTGGGYFLSSLLRFDRATEAAGVRAAAARADAEAHSAGGERDRLRHEAARCDREARAPREAGAPVSEAEAEARAAALSRAEAALNAAEEALAAALARLAAAQSALDALAAAGGDLAAGGEPPPAVAGAVADVVLEFNYSRDLRAGDTVTLTLPGFTAPGRSALENQAIPTAGPARAGFPSAEWRPAAAALRLRRAPAAPVLAAGDAVALRVPAHLALPSAGVPLSACSGITLAAEVRAGSSARHAVVVRPVPPPGAPRDAPRSLPSSGGRAPSPPVREDGPLPAHRVSHCHRLAHGLGPDERWYSCTARMASDMFAELAPTATVCAGERVVAVAEAGGRHRVISASAADEPARARSSRGALRKPGGSSGGRGRGDDAGATLAAARDDLAAAAAAARPSTSAVQRRLRNVGEYDVVLVCAPPSAAAALCSGCAPALARFAAAAATEPCWVAAVRLGAPLPVHFTAAAVTASPAEVGGGGGGGDGLAGLAWASRESARERAPHRPGRAAKMLRLAGRPSTGFAARADSEDLWALHSTGTWAERHRGDAPGDVAAALLAEFLALLGPAEGGGEGGVQVLEAAATFWPEARARLPPPMAMAGLREARACVTSAVLATARAGWGGLGIDGCLFDSAKGVGVAGDWMVDGTVEGAYLSGMALAGRVAEAHCPEVPADVLLPDHAGPRPDGDGPAGGGPAGGGLTHDDRWGRGPWPQLDADPVPALHRWNGRPVTGPQPRLVLPRPPRRGHAGGAEGETGEALAVGRPVTTRAEEDAEAGRLAGLSDGLRDCRPTTRSDSAAGAGAAPASGGAGRRRAVMFADAIAGGDGPGAGASGGCGADLLRVDSRPCTPGDDLCDSDGGPQADCV